MTNAGPDFSNTAGAGDQPDQYGQSAWGMDTSILTARVPVTANSGGGFGAQSRWAQGEGQHQTGLALAQGFYNLSPAQMTRLQIQLLTSGYDTREVKRVKFGQPDPGSYQAYTRAVGRAATSGHPLEEILGAGGDGNPEDLAALGATHVNVIQHRSDADVHAGMLKGFQAAIGRAPTAKEAAAFNAAFRGQETAAQPDTSGGGTFNVTDPGDPAAMAEQTARFTHPDLAQGNDRLQAFNVMLNALGVKG